MRIRARKWLTSNKYDDVRGHARVGGGTLRRQIAEQMLESDDLLTVAEGGA